MRVFSNNIYGKLHITPEEQVQKYINKIKKLKVVAANCLDYQLRAACL